VAHGARRDQAAGAGAGGCAVRMGKRALPNLLAQAAAVLDVLLSAAVVVLSRSRR
jgi:hypothetical protein